MLRMDRAASMRDDPTESKTDDAVGTQGVRFTMDGMSGMELGVLWTEV
jgi:hypothetical protein